MEYLSRLSRWLATSQRDYREGVQVFRELKVDPGNLAFFDCPHPARIHHSLLLRQLADYARIHQVNPSVLGHSMESVPASNTDKPIEGEPVSGNGQRLRVDKNPVVRYQDLPVNLQVLYDENGRMAREMKSLHAELKAIKDLTDQKQKRGQLARELVQRSQKSRENWEAVDSWWAEYHAPQDPSALAARQALEKDRRIKANLNYIRRFYGKPKNMPEVEIRMKELDKWGVSYEELVRKVSGAH